VSFVIPAVLVFDGRIQVVAVLATAVMFVVVIELVRRRRLIERYALLWMLVALALLVLALWDELLAWGSGLLGIEVPANALFLAAFAIGFLLLLNFSVVISRLSDQVKTLAQETARLDTENRALRGELDALKGEPGDADTAVRAGEDNDR
jgi:hypothetical protein